MPFGTNSQQRRGKIVMRCRRRHTSAKKGTEGTEKPKPTKPDQTRVGVRKGHCRSGDRRRSTGSCMKPLPLKTPTPLCPLHHKSKAEVLACSGHQDKRGQQLHMHRNLQCRSGQQPPLQVRPQRRSLGPLPMLFDESGALTSCKPQSAES